MDDTKLDFSSLDPSRHETRWENWIESIADRAANRHRQRLTVGFQLVRWSRPVLAAAAAVMLLFGARALLRSESNGNDLSKHFQRAYAMTSWAEGQQRPTTTNVMQVLGEPDVEK